MNIANSSLFNKNRVLVLGSFRKITNAFIVFFRAKKNTLSKRLCHRV